MSKQIIFPAIILAFLFNSANGQSRWETGYIIDLSGDTTYGYIGDKGKNSNANLCVFKEIPDGKVLRYSPDRLTGYRFNDGRYFVSKDIGHEKAAEPVFLEFLIKGEANVYHYVGNRFFIEMNGEMHELKNTEKTIRKGGNEYQVHGKEYIGVLSYLLQEADMQKDIQNTSFNPESLIKTAKRYHETVCKDEDCIIFKREIRPSRVRVGFQAGVIFNKLNFGRSLTSDYATGFAFGSRIVVENISYWSDRISLSMDPAVYLLSDYTLRSVKGESTRVEYAGQEYDITNRDNYSSIAQPSLEVKLNIVALNIPLYLNYSFHGKKGRPFLGAGVVNMFILSQSEDFTCYYFQNEYGRSIPLYHLGLTAILGYKMTLNNDNDLVLESSYQYTSNLNVNQFLRLQNHFLSVKIGYLF